MTMALQKIKPKKMIDDFEEGVCYPGNNDSSSLGLRNLSPKVSGNLNLSRMEHVEKPRKSELSFGASMVYDVHDMRVPHNFGENDGKGY